VDRRAVYLGLMLFAATVLTIWAGYLILAPFIVPIAWALCLLTVTAPLYHRLASWSGRPRLAALVMTLAVALFVVIPVTFVGRAVVTEALDLARSAEEEKKTPAEDKTGDAWHDFFAEHPKFDRVRAKVDEQLEAMAGTNLWEIKNAAQRQLSQPFAKGAVAVLQSLFTVLFGFVIMLVTLYFLFRDGAAILAWAFDVTPLPEDEARMMLQTLRSTAFAAIVGGLLTALIQGALGGIGFWIAGVGGAALWGAVMAVLSLLPFGGSAFLWLPVALYMLATGETWQGVFLLVWGGVVVGSSDNLLRPWLMRRVGAADIHPLLLFFAVLSGIGVFGFSGIVFGPLLVAVVLGALRIYRDHFGRAAVARRRAAKAATEADTAPADA
jgi:predicted PurR-regulated permease PerM